MEFEGKQPIYLQISDLVCENIITREWEEGGRIPSVRELAVETEVNPNTIMRTYAHLQDRQIIENRRGIGYFVAAAAAERTRAMKREEFIDRDLPRLFRTMELLGIDVEELRGHHERYRAAAGTKEENR
jgi:DNA-binding transcriptional regulator YhcF (GntR family)